MSRGCIVFGPSSARVDSTACTLSAAVALGAMMSLGMRPCTASLDAMLAAEALMDDVAPATQ
eukprot:11228157-Lingulodinium_polyedra.AAC.1